MMKRQASRPELLSARRTLARRLAEIDAALVVEASGRPFLTDDVCRAGLLAIREVARRKRQTVTLDEIGAFCTLSADAQALEQVLVALLEDAVHATDEGGEIGLSAVVDAQHGLLRFMVSDTSAAPDDRTQQLVSADRLAQVDRLVVAQGGYLAMSREPGRGRRVTVTLQANVTTPACSGATLVGAPAPLG